MKTAFITGVTGQDGAYLAQILLNKGYRVLGGVRRTSSQNFWRLARLGIVDDVEIVDFELLEQSNITKIFKSYNIDEFYNLAAQSFVGLSFEQPLYTSKSTGVAVLTILDAIKNLSPNTRFYQASTSEMFGKVAETPQKETTPFYPRSPYGVSKLFAHWSTINYRESYNLFACSGILFNHESPLRGEEFVTRKITKGLVDIKNGKLPVLHLGNLDSKRDWGFAGDYCNGIWKVLNHHTPDDYILATGETYSIREFIKEAMPLAGFKPEFVGEGTESKVIDTNTGKVIIEVDKRFFRPCEVDILLGDSTKARTVLDWQPKYNFKKLVHHMMEEELKYSQN